MLPSLAGRLATGAAPVDVEPGLRRLHLHDAVTGLLAHLGAEQPVLLILDDLQWADAATVALVGHVCRSDAVRMVLLAYRHSDVDRSGPMVTALADLRQARPVEVLHLHGLDVDEVSECVQARAGRACTPAVAHLVHTRTGGNPLFVEELTRSLVLDDALVDEARAASTAEVPEGVRSLVDVRVGSLDDAARAVLEGAAVLGAEFDWEALPDTVSSPADVVVAALDRLVAAGLLIEVRGTAGRYGFVHDIVRQALYGGLGSARRLTLHRKAAAAIAGFASWRPADVAHHLVAGATQASALDASAAAAAAAEDAAARFAHEEACRWYRQALEVLGDHGAVERRAALQLELAACLSLAGDFAAGRDGYRRAAALAEEAGDGTLLGRAALGFSGPAMAMWVQWGTLDEELNDLLDRADLAIDPVPSTLRASLLATRAAHLAVVHPAEADRWSAAALAMAESLGDRDSERAALVGRRLAVWRPDRIDERLTLDDRLIDLAGPARPLEEFDARTFLLMDLVETGRMAEADEAAARIKAIGERLDYSFATWNALRYECMRLAMAGRFDDCLALGGEALQMGMGANPENATSSYSGLLIGTSFLRHQPEGIADAMRAYAATVVGPSPFDALVPLFLVEEGRSAEAAVEVANLGARLDDIPIGPNWLTTLAFLSHPTNAIGDRAVAADLYQRLLPCAGLHVVAGGVVFTLGPVDRYLGLLAETVGDVDAADRHLTDAIAFCRAMGCTVYEAIGSAELGRVLLRAGRDADRVRSCLATAEALAADLDLGLVRKLLDDLAVGGR